MCTGGVSNLHSHLDIYIYIIYVYIYIYIQYTYICMHRRYACMDASIRVCVCVCVYAHLCICECVLQADPVDIVLRSQQEMSIAKGKQHGILVINYIYNTGNTQKYPQTR